MTSISCNSIFNYNVQKRVIDFRANQNMTAYESCLNDIVDVSKLNLRVGHPNDSLDQISKIGNMQVSNNLTLFDVFVVLDFNINLLSVHKLCKHSKCEIFLMNI